MTNACLIGFGEVGQTLAEDLSAGGVTLSSWDVLFGEPNSAIARACAATQVRGARSSVDAVRGAALVISAVTARQTIAAATEAAAAIEPGALYLDLNSAAP